MDDVVRHLRVYRGNIEMALQGHSMVGEAMKATLDDAKHVLQHLAHLGYDAYLAGGCVRDMQLGLTPNDYDITTSATPDQVQAAFPKTVPVGASFGVVKVIVNDRELDVATFRVDGKYSDNRRPDSVSYSRSAEEDVKRRDFTINGLLMNLDGKVIDYVGGLADLESRTLRTIGNAGDRFKEDALRMLRAIRFAVRFRMDIDDQAWLTIKGMKKDIKNISRERVTDELNKMFLHGQAERAYLLLMTSGLWQEWFGNDPNDGDNWRVMLALSKVTPSDSLTLVHAILIAEVYETRREPHIEKLSLTNIQKAGIESLLGRAKELVDFLGADLPYQRKMLQWENFDLVRQFIEYQHDGGKFRYYLPYPATRSNLEMKISEVRSMGWPADLVTGKDLIALGFIPGPAFSRMLDVTRDEQLEGRLLHKTEVKSFLIDMFPAVPRTLDDGTVFDDTKFRRVIAQCPKCFRAMSIEVPKSPRGHYIWSGGRERVNMRSYDTTEFAESSCCGGKRKKTSFKEAQL